MRRLLAVMALLLGSWLAERRPHDPVPSAGPLAPRGGRIGRFVVKHPWWTAAAIVAMFALGGAITVVSGIVPIRASSGHWAITAWLLDFAKTRSVSTHSFGIQPPPLDDEALRVRGAAHYEGGCSPCHGKPGAQVPPVMAAMTPPPPELNGRRISRWEPEELFAIVKHGIKFTGMPAWPAQQRDDEVWAVVSFLLELPRIDAMTYRALAYGADIASPNPGLAVPAAGHQEPPRAVREVCWRCHGIDGNGRGAGAFPRLAGQRSAYLYESLRGFAERRRFSGIMSGIAANLSEEAMREVAAYYERLPQRPAAARVDSAARERGQRIAIRGVPDRGIPACAECHGPTARPKNPAYPILAGQPARYLSSQLRLLQERRRGGSRRVNLMHAFVDRLDEKHIVDVTMYYSSLRSAR